MPKKIFSDDTTTLGEILFDKLRKELLPSAKKIGNQSYFVNEKKYKDSDTLFKNKTKNLADSWEKLCAFFYAMMSASESDLNNEYSGMFEKAGIFCRAMEKTVKDSHKIQAKDSDTWISDYNPDLAGYEAFDKALKLLFATENEKQADPLNDNLKLIDSQAKKNTGMPEYLKNPNAIEAINNKNEWYHYDKSGPIAVIHNGNLLIEGLKGLKTYINDHPTEEQSKEIPDLNEELTESIKLAEKAVTQQRQKLDRIRQEYLEQLSNDLTNSHRWLFKNSPEYTDMLNSANKLFNNWADFDAKQREELAQTAQDQAERYIRCKRGSTAENDWNPITKEGKKRRALAIYLRATAQGLIYEGLTNPNEKKLKINLIENNEGNLIEYDESDIIEISTSEKKENENDIFEKKEEDIIDPESLRKNRISSIKDQATFKLNEYTVNYDADNVATKDDLVAKAVAVNVLMQMDLNGAFNPEYTPKQIFSDDNIDKVAAAVKKLSSCKYNMDELEKKVLTNQENVTMFTFMDSGYINQLIVEGNLNINFEPQKAGPAANQSSKLNQGKDIDDIKTNDKKNVIKPTVIKPT